MPVGGTDWSDFNYKESSDFASQIWIIKNFGFQVDEYMEGFGV